MIGTERMLLGEQPEAPPVGDAPHLRNDIGKANEQWIASYRDRSGNEVLDEFRAVTGRRLEALRAMSTADWDREGFTPEGPGPYRQFMAIRVFDCWYHDQDIREALDRARLSRRTDRRSVARPHPAQGSALRRGQEGGRAAREHGGVRRRGRAADRGDGARSARGPGGAARHTAGRPDRHARARPAHVRAPRRRALERRPGAVDRLVAIDGDHDLGNRVIDNMAFTI